MANFHVDSSGNLWLGVTSTTFSESAPFYVKANGDVRANSIDLAIQEEDDADGSGGGNKRIDLGSSGSKIYDFGGDIFVNANDDVIVKDVLRLAETSGSVSEPSLLFGSSSASSGSQQNPVAGLTSRLVQANTHGGNSSHLARQLEVSNGSTFVMRFNSVNDEVEIPGDIKLATSSDIYIGTDPGSNGEVLMKSGGDIVWGTVGGGSHADSDHSFDDYGSWTLKRGGSTVGNVNSGFAASWNAGSGLSVSSNNNPFTITYSADFGGGNSQVARGDHGHTGTGISQINSPSVGLFSSYTFNSSGGQFSVSTIRSNDASYSFRNVFPTSGSASDLGHQFGNGRWRRLYTLNSPSVSSDERLKENIVDIPYGLDYINSLEPKQYNLKRVIVRGCNTCEMEIDEGVDECWNCTENGDTADIVDNLDVTGEKSGVINFGFTAQDLISTPPEPDVDIALVDYDEDSDEYGVRYNELIAPLVKSVQELSTQVSDLTARIEALEG